MKLFEYMLSMQLQKKIKVISFLTKILQLRVIIIIIIDKKNTTKQDLLKHLLKKGLVRKIMKQG